MISEEISRLPGAPRLVGGTLPRLGIMLLALGLVAILHNQPLALSSLAFGLAALAAALFDRRLVVPMVVLALPLEITKELFPFLYASESATSPDLRVSIVDFGRLAILFAALLWVVRAPPNWLALLPRSTLFLPLALIFALYVLSLPNTPDLPAGGRETLHLAFNVGFFLLIPLFVQDRQTLRWCLLALVVSGLALALAAVFQQAADVYFWNEGLGRGGAPYRNATFADPHHFARFLNIVIAVSIPLFFVWTRRMRYFLVVPTLGLCGLALLFTSSRSGWLTTVLLLPFLTLFLPLDRRYKGAILVGLALAAVGMAGLATVGGGAFLNRLETFRQGIWVIGARYYLIQAGWQMFLDNPLFGVGVGGFQESILGPYRSFIWLGRNTTLSHTALVTTIAELGLLGLAAIAFLFYRWGALCVRLYWQASWEDKAVVVGLAGAFLAILISSQAEGRFLEDPYLWLVFGLGVALERLRATERLLAGATMP